MNFANIDIKKYIVENGYTQKQIAEKLGITQEWFSRLLRHELPEEEKQAIKMAVDGDMTLWCIRHRTYISMR